MRRSICRAATWYMSSEKVESTLEWRNETNGAGSLSLDTGQEGRGVQEEAVSMPEPACDRRRLA